MTDIYHEQLAEGERVELALEPTETVYRVEFLWDDGIWRRVEDTYLGDVDFSNYDEAARAAHEYYRRSPHIPFRVVSRNIEVQS